MACESNNSTNSTNSSNQNQQDKTIQLVIMCIIVVIGLIGNSLVIAVVKVIRAMRSTTNYLLVNVAAADNTTHLFTIIHVVVSKQRPPYSPELESFLCKFIISNTIPIVTLLVTVLTLTLLAVERYQALMKPLTPSRRLTTDKIAYVIVGIWVTSLALVTPMFAAVDICPNTQGRCSFGEARERMFVYICCLMAILTIIPFTIIAFCYSQIIYGMHVKKTICNNNGERGATQEETREKQRLVRVLILLTVVFFAAFIPYGLLMILEYSKVGNVRNLRYWAQYLTLLNCSVNPLIYAIQSSGYRRGFLYILKKITCRDTTVDVMELREMQMQWSVRSGSR